MTKMKEPLASIFWLNYNSSSFIDVALESLEGILNLDFSNFELIVVDNASTDGSSKVIESFIDKKMDTLKVKFVKLPKNLGFTGGNNVAYRVKNPESKYVVFLNNDAVPYPNSLKRLIEFMETDNSVGALQGTIVKYDGRSFESAGNIITEFFTVNAVGSNLPSKPRNITYADGTYSVHRVSSIRKAVGGRSSIFDDHMFAYYDDSVLGLKMWNTYSKVMTFPVIGARHKGSFSFGRIKPFQAYLETRGWATLNEISNSKFKELNRLVLIYTAYTHSLVENKVLDRKIGRELQDLLVAILKGSKDGGKIGRAKRKSGEYINLYQAPIARVTLPMMVGLLPGVRFFGIVVAHLNHIIAQSYEF